MNKLEFQRIMTIEEDGLEDIEKNLMGELEVGDFFLYGKSMINQKQNKAIGQPISYYEVLEISDSGSIVYGPVFDTLEEGNINERE